MQRSLFFTSKRRGTAAHAALLLAASLAGGARAAELGDLQVHSYLGQPLVADIELVSIAADEAASLQVRLASPDVYRIANIAIQPVLQGLNVTLMRREQRQFLHITSLKPIDTSHLVLFFELTGAGRSAVRESTVLLSPDPHPPAPLPPPYIPPPVAPMPAPALAPPAPVPDAALVAALARAAMPAPAFKMPAVTPAADAGHHAHAAAAAPEHEPAAKPEPPKPKPEPHPVAAVTAKVEDSSAYIALDKKNAALNKKLLELEGKIRQLQDQVGVKPVAPAKSAAPGAPASAPAEPAPVKAAPRPLLHKLKPLKAAPAPKKPAETGISPLVWLGIGTAALLLLIGIGVFLFQRRHRRKGDRSPSKLWGTLSKPFQRRKGKTDSLPVVVESPLTEPGNVDHE